MTVACPGRTVTSVDFSPDGAWIAAATVGVRQEFEVTVWAVHAGEAYRTLSGYGWWAGFCRDGSLAAWVPYGWAVIDLETGREKLRLEIPLGMLPSTPHAGSWPLRCGAGTSPAFRGS